MSTSLTKVAESRLKDFTERSVSSASGFSILAIFSATNSLALFTRLAILGRSPTRVREEGRGKSENVCSGLIAFYI